MSIATRNRFIEAVEQLPSGAALLADNVSWGEYEELLTELADSYHAKIAYDHGRIEIMSPVSTHEREKNLLNRLLSVLSDELEIDIESLGSTTYKERAKAIGAEPDDSFHIQNVAAVMAKRENINMTEDPPPDLVVEIDYSSSSLNKFSIYAGFGVPELWRVRNHRVQIWWLTDGQYEESVSSRAFPFLPANVLSEFLEKGLSGGARKAAQAFRQWVHHRRGD